MEKGTPALGWAARDDSGLLSPYSFSRRVQKDEDVTIKVLFCGICHTDLHIAKNEWGNALYPVVPGHEIVGVVTDVGPGVKSFKAGDTVGVGYFLDSCRSCHTCSKGYENYCPTIVLTSNGVDYDGATTQGGFSDVLVVNQDYVLRVPENLSLAGAAPLLCAGVTMYSPMMQYGLNAPGKHLGVVGLGGLGHMAVKFGKAFGMTVTVISSSPRKREEALERLGADAFLVSQDAEQMKAAAGTMDGIIDTVSAGHPLVPLLELLKPMGQMVAVGAPSEPLALPAYAIIGGGKRVAGNGVGSVSSCQAMLDFAGKHGITADVEVVKMDYVNTAIERLERNNVRYRFVIDVAGSQLGASA
ncbi:probable cinnamyl alcohol dehydrogenase 8D [Triticum dicoccoides]|uniref:probable cinnamyl alcohol dehydrogenase 8D n=1 Tax=Triticum dicoccoides TaxID=85692 RepID=UPI00188E016C|nr:probable cinnamyl alcohol dehydrogenase 8D [Triticum dicoccoides]